MDDHSATQPNYPVYQPPFTLPSMAPPPPARKRLPVWAIVVMSIAGVLLACCVGIGIFDLTPAGQQFLAQANATSTAQALADVNAHATATAFVLAHPTATSLLQPTSTSAPKPIPTTTSTPKPTATHAPPPTAAAVLNGATFGGMQAAFDEKYGASPDGLYQQGNLTFSINLTTGTDNQQHVFGMLIYNTDATTWPLDQAKLICPIFNPPDAHLIGTAPDSQGNYTEIYHSARLQATLPADQFAPDPPGDFIIDYEKGQGLPDIFQCSVNP